MNRSLKDNEEVHHLDEKRDNNLPSNILVLENTQHGKLHNWLRKQIIVPNPLKIFENNCKICGNKIEKNKTFCSDECKIKNYNIIKPLTEKQKEAGLKRIDGVTERPSKEELLEDVKSMPMTLVGKKYGVSDNAIRRWLENFGLPIHSSAYSNKRG